MAAPPPRSGGGSDARPNAPTDAPTDARIDPWGLRPSLPTGLGLGLRWAFLPQVAEAVPSAIRFFEVGPENYMGRGGRIRRRFDAARRHVPILTHGVTMNVGGRAPLDPVFLRDLRRFLDDVGAPYHSDHLCWTETPHAKLHDLLPVPTDPRIADRCVDRIRRIADALGRPFAIENVSYYLSPGGAMPETEFLCDILERADAGLLLDINNVIVNATNLGFDPYAFVDALPLSRVLHLHVAGGTRRDDLGGLVIDTHGRDAPASVGALMRYVLSRTGPLPVLLERDHAIPPLPQLVAELEGLQALADDALATAAPIDAPADRPHAGRRDPPVGPRLEVEHAIEISIERAVRAPSLPADFTQAPTRALTEAGLGPDDAAAVASIGGERLAVYRTLVRAGVFGTMEDFLPRTRRRLGTAAFEQAVARWFAQVGPASRYLRDLPGELVETWRRTPHDLPADAVDLARYEVLTAQVEASPDVPPPDDLVVEVAPDKTLMLDPSATVAAFDHWVVEPDPAPEAEAAPASDPATPQPGPPLRGETTRVLQYRDPEGAVRTMTLSALAHDLLEPLLRGETVADAIRAAAAAPPSPEVLGRISTLLADLAERGVVRGHRP